MYDILHHIEVNAKPEIVFKAITTLDGLQCWWTLDVQFDQSLKTYTFGFNHHSVLLVMKIIKERINKTMVWKCFGQPNEWKDTILQFNLTEKDNYKTILKFRHSNWKSVNGEFAKCNTDWGHLMYYLKKYAEGENYTPLMK